MDRLLAFCRSFPNWIAHTVSHKAALLTEQVADGVKDGLLDLGYSAAEDDQLEAIEPIPLPPLDSQQFAAALDGPVADALQRVAVLINNAPGGLPPTDVEQQVHAIFEGLARNALWQAFELRMAAAEADLPPSGAEWARRYRRMMAREGRWPVPEDSDFPSPQP
jgi:hypothetical protein